MQQPVQMQHPGQYPQQQYQQQQQMRAPSTGVAGAGAGGGNIPVPAAYGQQGQQHGQQQQQVARGYSGSQQQPMLPMNARPSGPAPILPTAVAKRSIDRVDMSAALSTADVLKQHKRRKLTDRALPRSLLASKDVAAAPGGADLAALVSEYDRLLDLEKSLDLTLTRRKAELADDTSSGKRTVHRLLRVRLTSECRDQPWQKEQERQAKEASNGTGEAQEQQQEEDEQPDFESGRGIPSWTCKIEGKLLELNGEDIVNPAGDALEEGNAAPPAPDSIVPIPTPKFSQLVQHLSIDIQRPEGKDAEDTTNLHREPSLINWAPFQHSPPTSGFSFTRSSTSPTPIKLSLYMSQHPRRFKVSPDLGNLLDVREETRIGVLERLWGYVQRERLIEHVGSGSGQDRGIKCDEKLSRIFGGAQKLQFWQMAELVNKYLAPADPVTLDYTVDVSPEHASRSATFDIHLELPDPSLHSLAPLLRSMSSPASAQNARLLAIDEELAGLSSSIHTLAYQHSLLERFSADPAGYINEWMRSQSIDLRDLLEPDADATPASRDRMARLRDSKWFGQDWVRDAVGIHVARGQQVASR